MCAFYLHIYVPGMDNIIAEQFIQHLFEYSSTAMQRMEGKSKDTQRIEIRRTGITYIFIFNGDSVGVTQSWNENWHRKRPLGLQNYAIFKERAVVLNTGQKKEESQQGIERKRIKLYI